MPTPRNVAGPSRKLTRREREVLEALCGPLALGGAFVEPASSRAMAEALGVSDAAVKQHLLQLYSKFGIADEGGESRRTRLANKAVAAGIVNVGGPSGPSVATDEDPLALARKAVGLRNWPRALELFARAPKERLERSADDQEMLGEAAIWAGDPELSIAARQRAHALHAQAGNAPRAALVALSLVVNYVMRNNLGQASGWLAKAHRHLDASPRGLAQGYVLFMDSVFAMYGGQLEKAATTSASALEIADEGGDLDLRAMSLAVQGYALCVLGQQREGRLSIDEAMASATGGELGPLAIGFIYCRAVCASMDTFDHQRALEWMDAIERAGADSCMAGFPGDCRAHRASLYVMRGDWDVGAVEAKRACEESRRVDLRHAGLAENELGTLRLRSGDLDGAEAAFLLAHQLGHSPQPGLALLHLARGRLDQARSLIQSAVDEAPKGTALRGRLLPALFEIALAQSDVAGAEEAHHELAAIASVHTTAPLRAAAAAMGGILLRTQGDGRRACVALRAAISLWLEAGVPYETARARLELARALSGNGEGAAAALEVGAALPVLQRMGAVLSIEQAKYISEIGMAGR